MKRFPVVSSNIKSIGYDQAAKQLEVEFRAGGTYLYDEVPTEMFNDLMGSESLGKFFASSIRFNYKYKRI